MPGTQPHSGDRGGGGAATLHRPLRVRAEVLDTRGNAVGFLGGEPGRPVPASFVKKSAGPGGCPAPPWTPRSPIPPTRKTACPANPGAERQTGSEAQQEGRSRGGRPKRSPGSCELPGGKLDSAPRLCLLSSFSEAPAATPAQAGRRLSTRSVPLRCVGHRHRGDLGKRPANPPKPPVL